MEAKRLAIAMSGLRHEWRMTRPIAGFSLRQSQGSAEGALFSGDATDQRFR